MQPNPPWLTQDLVQSGLVAAGVAVHSLRTRGPRRAAVFAALALGLPALGEHHAVRVQRSLRHHMQPQVRGVPLPAVLGWYGIAYATYAISGSTLAGRKRRGRRDSWPAPVMTAVLATDLDLLLDAYGLDRGLWEWRAGGPYAADIMGPNGQRGVPLENFAGWMLLTGGETALYEWLVGDPDEARSEGAGRAAALLLLPYFLLPALWSLQRRKAKYLLCASPFAAALWKGLRG